MLEKNDINFDNNSLFFEKKIIDFSYDNIEKIEIKFYHFIFLIISTIQ